MLGDWGTDAPHFSPLFFFYYSIYILYAIFVCPSSSTEPGRGLHNVNKIASFRGRDDGNVANTRDLWKTIFSGVFDNMCIKAAKGGSVVILELFFSYFCFVHFLSSFCSRIDFSCVQAYPYLYSYNVWFFFIIIFSFLFLFFFILSSFLSFGRVNDLLIGVIMEIKHFSSSTGQCYHFVLSIVPHPAPPPSPPLPPSSLLSFLFLSCNCAKQ